MLYDKIRNDKTCKTCFSCSNAYLMQSSIHNPIVSDCMITHQREVANTPIKCVFFKPKVGDVKIHPMVPCR